ncbi:MAG: hypothetical protein HY268_30415 [Deltaproteobacteria bacterium]|nr:hypothetical protein [Deltaproteobacteria bacterium]
MKPTLQALLTDAQLSQVVDSVLFRRNKPGSGYRRMTLVEGQLQPLAPRDSGYDKRRNKLIQKLDSIRSGDILIVLKNGYYFDKPKEYPGNHGGLAITDLRISLVLAGPGIQPEEIDPTPVSNTQVVATVYKFLTGRDLPQGTAEPPLPGLP